MWGCVTQEIILELIVNGREVSVLATKLQKAFWMDTKALKRNQGDLENKLMVTKGERWGDG